MSIIFDQLKLLQDVELSWSAALVPGWKNAINDQAMEEQQRINSHTFFRSDLYLISLKAVKSSNEQVTVTTMSNLIK